MEMKNYFSKEEQTCNCGCGTIIEHEVLLGMLNRARIIAGIPFIVTSWTRCLEYNRKIGSKDTSSHITGKAVDIKFRDNNEKFNIVSALIAVGFVRVGINDKAKFIHVDLDMDKFQKTLFSY